MGHALELVEAGFKGKCPSECSGSFVARLGCHFCPNQLCADSFLPLLVAIKLDFQIGL